MKVDRRQCTRVSVNPPKSLTERLLRWLLSSAPAEERYLSAATDHADLERRMRNLEHATAGPALVTFNH